MFKGTKIIDNLRPEEELLLCCARVRHDCGARIGTLIERGVEWNLVKRLAWRHGLTSLLYWNLRAVAGQLVPQTILAELHSSFQQTARQNLLLTGELLKLLDLLNSHGIQALAYRGPVLAESAYGNLALREFADLDLFIRKSDAPRIVPLVALLGDYQIDTAPAPGQIVFVRSDGRIRFEIHWTLVPRPLGCRTNPDAFFERAQAIPINRKQVLTFASEDLLLGLCIHGAKHQWQQLKWICDVAELLQRHDEFDWDFLLAEAKRQGCLRMLQLGLSLANHFLGAPLPDAIAQTIDADTTLPSLREFVLQVLFQSADVAPWFHFKIRERFRDRLRLALAPSASDMECVPLPAFLSPLYFAVRPFRLLTKYGRRLLHI